MTKVYTWQFDVRTYELDENGFVRNAALQNYLEEGATQASAASGFPMGWYWENRIGWVIRKMKVRYVQPLRYGDKLRLRTWVSDFRRVRSHREYDLRRADDDQPVLRARCDWVFVNLDTMRPQRIPEEFGPAFSPSGDLDDDLDPRPQNAASLPDSPQFTSHRVAQHYELDPTSHVNNSVYLNWVDDALFRAMRQAGWSAGRMREVGYRVALAGREIEYFRPALSGEKITISGQLVEMAGAQGAWVHEIRHAESDELIARDYSVGALMDLNSGELRQFPKEVWENL